MVDRAEVVTPPAHLHREYIPSEVVWFWKTTDTFGGLSNMARGFPMVVGGHPIASVEALYQALRFPHSPTIQGEILAASNAWLAKRAAQVHAQESRSDWRRVRVAIMRWCLKLKLGHSPTRFGALLDRTGVVPIVERSSRDTFWGAVAQPDGRLVGANVLGRLLMELRELCRRDGAMAFHSVPAPDGLDLHMLGAPILTTICAQPADTPLITQEQLALPTTPTPTSPARPRPT